MASAAREPGREQGRMVRFGHARWDRAGRRLTVRGEAVKLSWKTAECLNLLVEARGEVVPKEDLLREVLGAGLVEESNLAQCISVLRKSLDPAPDGGSHIGTAARVGYRLAVDVEEEAAAAVVVAEVGGVKRGRYPRIVWALGCVALLTVMAGGGEAYRRMERRERADELLERARGMMRRSSLTEAEKAPGLIQEAIDLVPGYAPAQAAFAEASARLGKTTFEASVELARLAVRNDPECGECRAVLGYVLGTRGWRWEEAGEHLARAVALDGNRLHWRLWYADWLAAQGRLEEAAVQAGEAKRIDPTEPRVYSAMASLRFLRGDYRGAIQEGEKATALNRSFSRGTIGCIAAICSWGRMRARSWRGRLRSRRGRASRSRRGGDFTTSSSRFMRRRGGGGWGGRGCTRCARGRRWRCTGTTGRFGACGLGSGSRRWRSWRRRWRRSRTT